MKHIRVVFSDREMARLKKIKKALTVRYGKCSWAMFIKLGAEKAFEGDF